MGQYARTHVHIGLTSLHTCAHASALLACFPHTVKKMPASQHRFPSLLLRNGTFLHALFWQSVWKICPSVIWYFPWVSRLKNMESRRFSARGWRPRAKNLFDSMFFNLDTEEKYQITLGHFFHTLCQNNAWRKVPFHFGGHSKTTLTRWGR